MISVENTKNINFDKEIDNFFTELSKDLHFNVTKLINEEFGQNWRVPEGFISIIGLDNAKFPVFYYGVTEAKEKQYFLKKERNQVFVRLKFIFDRRDLIEKEKYIVANAFHGLLLLIKIDKKEFINMAKEILRKAYDEDEVVKKSINIILEKNLFDSLDEAIEFIANRDYNWLMGRIRYNLGNMRYSGEGYYLIPLKTKLEITPGLIVEDNNLIIDLENAHTFKNFIIYLDTKNKKVYYNKERLCNKKPALVNIKVDEDHCPWCGAKLRVVKTKKGEFLGCTNYPKCLYRRFPKQVNNG
ncbi:topoisomerase DNA-binding C4 zinc finger domain-containing protein [Methanocaldococcus sp.]